MKHFALFASVLLVLSCNCTGDLPDNEGVPKEYAAMKRVPLKSEITAVQPMTGIVLWNTNSRNKTADIQLEFSYMLYNDVCKEKDVFDWTPMDKLLEQVASRGHQAVVRFRYTYVGQECAVPDYIKVLPDYEETVGKSEGARTCFPDWRCDELKRFHMEFHRRFAERYDTDPRLAFVETGYGLWAEYHIYDGPFIMGRTFPDKAFQAEFMRAMEGWFKETTYSISIDAADGKYGPFKKDKSLLDLRFGNFDDSFMCEDHDGYNYESWKFFGEERYKRAPMGGEFSYYTKFDQRHCLDAEGMYGRVFEDEVAKYHMTFIIGDGQPMYQSWDRIREASLSMGYKFRVKDFRVGKKGAAVLVENVGVAPIYRDAFVSVDGIRSEYSLAQLMPGESQWIAFEGKGFTAESKVAVECDHLVPGQSIGFEADVQ